MPVVGFLGSDSPDLFADLLRAFRKAARRKFTGALRLDRLVSPDCVDAFPDPFRSPAKKRKAEPRLVWIPQKN
jgi:hypothetical protein